MSTLTGQKIANTYKQLLQVGTDNNGLTATVQTVQDGAGTNSPLQLSNSAVNINGTFQLNGSTLTATAAELNAIADLTGTTGIVAVSAGQVYGRTLTAGSGVSITNADGTEGNPTIALNPSGVAAGSYGPLSNIEVNSVGQVVSISTETSVSVSVINASSFIGEYLNLSANASIVGDVNIDGNTSIGGSAWINGPVSIVDSLYIGTNLSVTGNTKTDFLYAVSADIGDLRADTLTFSAVSVSAFSATTLLVANNLTGVSATFSDNVSVANLNAGTNIYIAGSPVALASSLAATSLALATSIDTANTRITSVSDFAVALSATFATSIDTANTRITSVSDYAVALSATLATSISNSNTNIATVSALTSVNSAAITSINTVVANVSALTSVNTAAITSINTILGDGSGFATDAELAAVSAALATSIANHLPLAGGTMTGIIAGFESTGIDDNASSTAMTINSSGNVGIGTSLPSTTIHISTGAGNGILLEDNNTSNVAPNLTIIGKRGDGNGSQSFTGKVRLAKNQTNAAIDGAGDNLGTVLFGGNHTDSSISNILYAASISGISEGAFNSSTDMPTGLAFYTGSTGQDGDTANVSSGTERMRIDSSGNVGIGTSSPTERLDVTTSGTQVARFTSTAASNNNAVVFETAGSGSSINLWFTNSSADASSLIRGHDYLSFHTGGTNTGGRDSGSERMRISNSGEVSIGTTSGGHKLRVAKGSSSGTALFEGSGYQTLFGYGANDDNYISSGASGATIFRTSSTERMRIDSSGQLGIGVSPSYKIDVSNAAGNIMRLTCTTASGTAILMLNGTSAGGAVSFQRDGSTHAQIASANADGDLLFKTTTSYTERMRIVGSTGNIGLGTSSPSYKLDLRQGGATATQAMRVADGTPTEYFGIFNSNTGGNTPNAANATVKVRGMDVSNRSINAGGTVNASGADYAEYMYKADGCGTIAKGDVCGVDADGRLTDQFDNAHSFVIKSTDPSYVGGDIWSKTGQIDDKGHEILLEGDALEAARQDVDRIAFAGQVPCNITGPVSVGQYVVPQRSADGSIEAICVNNPTLDQYISAVGRVWKMGDANTHLVAVKIG